MKTILLASSSVMLTLLACGEPLTEPPSVDFARRAKTYTLQNLGTLVGNEGASEADAINSKGQVVGYSETAAGEFHAFLWEDGQMIDLGTLGGTFVRTSRALGINSKGQIVGVSTAPDNGSFLEHAFLWQNGVMIDLGTPDAHSSALAINPAGVVVGHTQPIGSPFQRAVLWRGGVMVHLGTLGGNVSVATGINPAGQIVGYSETSSGAFHAFVWNKGTMTDLGTLGGGFSSAAAINASGQVVGESVTESGETHAFLWSRGVMTDLGTLDGDTQSHAMDINASGQVTGWSQATRVGFAGRAFVWHQGVMTDLGTGVPNRALGINNAGVVVGSNNTHSGSVHATLWRP